MNSYGIASVAPATLGCESGSGSAVVLKGLTMLLRLLRFAVLAATVASGLVLVVKPESVSGFTGLIRGQWAAYSSRWGWRRSSRPISRCANGP